MPVKCCNKYAKLLEQYGIRIQNSVFLIEDEKLFIEVQFNLEKIFCECDKIFVAEIKRVISNDKILNLKMILI